MNRKIDGHHVSGDGDLPSRPQPPAAPPVSPRCSGCNRLSPATLRNKGSGIYWCGRTDCLWRVRELLQQAREGQEPATTPAMVTATRTSRGIRITATRGAVTTEATLTEDEALQLHGRLGRLLYGPECRFEYCTAPAGECGNPE